MKIEIIFGQLSRVRAIVTLQLSDAFQKYLNALCSMNMDLLTNRALMFIHRWLYNQYFELNNLLLNPFLAAISSSRSDGVTQFVRSSIRSCPFLIF